MHRKVLLNCSSKENFFDDQRPKTDDSKNEPFCPFTLPEDEFGEMMFAKRFKPEGSSSPPILPYHPSAGSGAGARRQSAVEDTDGEPGSNSRIDALADRQRTSFIASTTTWAGIYAWATRDSAVPLAGGINPRSYQERKQNPGRRCCRS